ncbi:MAG: hypothetical protein ACKO96_33920 [Flammeovirgaceae bacterium]
MKIQQDFKHYVFNYHENLIFSPSLELSYLHLYDCIIVRTICVQGWNSLGGGRKAGLPL